MLKVAQKNTISFNKITKNINYQLLIETHSRKSKNTEKRSRYRRSDAEPDDQKLPFPRNFLKGNAVGEGDCFFDSLAQEMNQLNLGQSFDVKSLRQACFDYARGNAEAFYGSLKDKTWQQAIAADAHDVGYATGNTDESADFNSYLVRIQLTAEEINNLDLGPAIWGRPEIEGRLLCQKYGIKIHLIEKHTVDGQEVIVHSLEDGSGSRQLNDKQIYNDPKVVHILNERRAHFVPILHKSSASNKQIEKQARSSPIDRLAQSSATNSQRELAIPHVSKSDNNFSDINNKLSKIIVDKKDILEKDANVNFKDINRKGNTRLHLATKKGELEIVDFLLTQGADSEIQNEENKISLELAKKIKRKKIVDSINWHTIEVKERKEKISVNNQELLISAGEGNAEKIQSLIHKEKADVNFQDRNGNTALHHAVKTGKLEIVKFLLDNGANIKINNSNKNPLDLSRNLNKKNITPILEWANEVDSLFRKYLDNVQEQDNIARNIFNIDKTSKNLLPISNNHYLILNGDIGNKVLK